MATGMRRDGATATQMLLRSRRGTPRVFPVKLEGPLTMTKPNAGKSGSFRIGGDIEIHRLGFGAMRLTGPGIWGQPADRVEAIRTLKRAPELGIDFIDTADSYGPAVSEQLIREALYPDDGILIATKAGLRRPSPGQWEPDGRPEYLHQQAIKSRDKLGLEQIA